LDLTPADPAVTAGTLDGSAESVDCASACSAAHPSARSVASTPGQPLLFVLILRSPRAPVGFGIDDGGELVPAMAWGPASIPVARRRRVMRRYVTILIGLDKVRVQAFCRRCQGGARSGSQGLFARWGWVGL